MPDGASLRTSRLVRGVLKTISSCARGTRPKSFTAEPDEVAESPSATATINPHPSSSQHIFYSSPTSEPDVFNFFPSPIDTSLIMQLPDSVIALRDKLARNLHEIWSLNKIEAGWTFAENREDAAKKHNCLTEYENLTEIERSYDTTLTMETLKTLAAMGYKLCKVDPSKVSQTPPLMNVSESYRQSNGYKPVPYDLSSTVLTREIEDLVETLAANLHNIWAKNRIEEGWRYGQSEDNSSKRSPNLVPYDKIDYAIKKANRDSVLTIVKGLIAFGSDLCSPETTAKITASNQRLLRRMSNNGFTPVDSSLLKP